MNKTPPSLSGEIASPSPRSHPGQPLRVEGGVRGSDKSLVWDLKMFKKRSWRGGTQLTPWYNTLTSTNLWHGCERGLKRV